LSPETLFQSVDFIDLNRSSAKPSGRVSGHRKGQQLSVLIRKGRFRMRTRYLKRIRTFIGFGLKYYPAAIFHIVIPSKGF
ncbi:MAG: hypothetical protein C0407_10090, partial [Desulfobacca sp.]|nr:hypothetical protein [Desulfobacca sp.]